MKVGPRPRPSVTIWSYNYKEGLKMKKILVLITLALGLVLTPTMASATTEAPAPKSCSDAWCKAEQPPPPALDCESYPQVAVKAATNPVTVRGSGANECNVVPSDWENSVWQLQISVYQTTGFTNYGAPVTSNERATWIYRTDSVLCKAGGHWWRLKQSVDARGLGADNDLAYGVARWIVC